MAGTRVRPLVGCSCQLARVETSHLGSRVSEARPPAKRGQHVRYRRSCRAPRHSDERRIQSGRGRPYAERATLGRGTMEILIWPVAFVVGGGLLWAVLNEVVYRLARVARRGWEDEGLALREQRDGDTLNQSVL